MDNKCTATTKSGAACSGTPLPGREWCWSHDPQLNQRRVEGQRRGGSHRSNAARAKRQFVAESLDSGQVLGLLSVALRGVLTGRLEPGIANAAANLGRAIVAVRESTETEARIASLEAAAGISERTAS